MQCGNYVYAACRAAGNCGPYGPLNMNSPHFRRIFNHTHICRRQVANYSRLLIQKQRAKSPGMQEGGRWKAIALCVIAVDPFPKVKFSIEFPFDCRPASASPFTSCCCCSYMRAILVDISSDNNLQSNHLSTHTTHTHTYNQPHTPPLTHTHTLHTHTHTTN